MRKNINSLIFLIFLLSSQVYSQLSDGIDFYVKENDTDSGASLEINSSTTNKINLQNVFLHIPSDFEKIVNNALSSNNTNTLLGLTLITTSLLNLDQRTWYQTRLNYNKYSTFRSICDFSVSMGDGKYHLLLAGLFSTYGLVIGDSRTLKTAFNISEAVLATGICVQILKRVTGRETPLLATKSTGKWDFFPNLKEYQKNQPKFFSFPSGHIATATATLTVIANNFPEIKWIKPVGASLLGLIGLGLVSNGLHWYSDLPLGILLGYSFGNIIAPGNSNDENEIEANNFDHFYIIPNFQSYATGFSVGYAFH